jgi:hypothetical protein
MLDRRWVPARATERPFAHDLKLSGDLLERAIGCRRLDAGDQMGPTVVALLCPGAVQQAGLDYAFVVQPPHRTTQPFDGPRSLPARGSGPARRRHKADPGASAARSAARRPVAPGGLQMRGVAPRAQFSDGILIAGAEAGIATDATAVPRGT